MQKLLNDEQYFIKTFAEEILVECFAKGVEIDVRFAEHFVSL